MAGRRYLLMHIAASSGHERASWAIEQAITQLEPSATVVRIDASAYTSRFVRWMISRTYHSLIKHQPDVWEYLYDNTDVYRGVQDLRTLLHRYHAKKLGQLLQAVRPDVIACTQAYPCGMVADFKKQHGLAIPLVGILTDHAPHMYWFHDTVDAYVVPSEQAQDTFVQRGVPRGKVKALGIPIDARFIQRADRADASVALGLDPARPVLLLMGGGSGFGPLRDILTGLDRLPHPVQLVVVAGMNRSLHAWAAAQTFRHPVRVLGYTEDVPALMDAATLLISKPGGMTSAEALAKQLPLVIVNPIPGQEAYNARFLTTQGAAVQAESANTVRQTIRDLLDDPARLDAMRHSAAGLAKPNAALDIVRLLGNMADHAYDSRLVELSAR